MMTGRAFDATARDMANRARGIAAATRGRLSPAAVDDVRLLERVRAKLGRACSHPRAIDVDAQNGEVTLRGPILANEVDDVIRTVGAVPGVMAVVNELDSHESPEGIPSLQGQGGTTAEPTLDIFQRHWAPATRALVGLTAMAAGMAVAAYSRR
jgi:hypothetical protein